MRTWLIGLALLLVPLLDAILLVFVAVEFLGPVATIALVVVTALVGMLLVRVEGRRTLAKIGESLARGEPPTDELLDGGFLVAAGAFFLTPGLVTDSLGLLFTIPVTRVPIRMAVKRWIVVPYIDGKTGGFASGQVYVGGFPGDGDDDEGGVGAWSGGSDPGPGSGPGPFGPSDTGGDDVYDLGEDEVHDVDPEDYEIDVENVREDPDGN